MLGLLVCFCGFIYSTGQESKSGKNEIKWVETEELIRELKDVPQTNASRAEKLIELFTQAGVKDIKRQEIDLANLRTKVFNAIATILMLPKLRNRAFNVIATVPGASEDIIIVGAHTDFRKDRGGQGVIDDWSGANMLGNLAQTLLTVERKCTFIFVGFTMEEKGLIGSGYYVKNLPDEVKAKIKAMVNLECHGVSRMKCWLAGSTDSLEILASHLARQLSMTLSMTHRARPGWNTDSNNFLKEGIPAIAFDSLDDKDFPLIDSPRDLFEEINTEHYREQYVFLTHYLLALDKYEKVLSPANKDKPRPHARLGFRLDRKQWKKIGMFIVGQVFPGSPEEKAGLEKGDRLIEFGGVKIEIMDDFTGRFRPLKEGDKIQIKVQRAGKEVALEAQY